MRLNGSGLIAPVHITSIASPLVPSSLAEALARCPTEMNLPSVVIHWRLLVAFLSKLEGDDQEAIDHEAVYHVQAAECVEAETPPTPRRPPRLLPSERRRLQKEAKAAEKRAREEARAAAEAAAVAEADAVLERQAARPDATSAMLTSVLLKRGGTASAEVVARARAKRDSLKAAEMRARKPAKAMPERPNDCRVRGSWLRPSSSNGALAHGSGVARSCSAGSAAVPRSSFSSRFGPGYSSE